jgi:hypothetical protein
MAEADRRRGVVLLAILAVLAVVGTLLVASYFAERARWADRQVASRSVRLRGETGTAVVDAVAQWDSAARFAQPVGTTEPLAGPWPSVPWPAQGVVTRLSPWSYRVAVRLHDPRDSTLWGAAAALLSVDAPRFVLVGALVADGDVAGAGSFSAFAPDSAVAAACGAGTDSGTGIAIAPGHTGPPGSTTDPVAGADSTYAVFGGVSYDTAAAGAELVLPGGSRIAAPVANTTHALGDLTLTGGSGSGLLLVDGSLTVAGDVSYRGVVVAARGVVVSEGEWRLSGMALSGPGDPSVDVKPNAAFELWSDPCAVLAAEWHAGRLKFVETVGANAPR